MTKRDNSTLAVGAGLIASGGVLREVGVRRAHRAYYQHPDTKKRIVYGSRKAFPGRTVFTMPKASKSGKLFGRGKARALYLGGTALGAAGVPALAAGTFNRDVEKRDNNKNFVLQGLEGTRDAVHQRTDTLLARDVPKRARAEQAATAIGAGAVGSLLGHRVMDRFPKAGAGLKRSVVTSLAGAGAGLATVPLSQRRIAHKYPGYEIAPGGGVRRKKKGLKSPSSSAHVIDGRNGASRSRFRSEVVPSDVRKLDTNYAGYGMSHRQKQARVFAAGGPPLIGDFTAAAQAARLAPPEQRRSAAVTQFASSNGGQAAGAAAGAYGGAALVGRVKHLEKPAVKTDTAITNARQTLRRKVGLGDKKPKGEFASRKWAQKGPGKTVGRTLTRLGKPISRRGKAGLAGAAIGGLAGQVVGGQAGGYYGYEHLVLRREDRRNDKINKRAVVAPEMSVREQRRQIARKKRNAALTTLSSTAGLAAAGTFTGSLVARKPLRSGLRTASLGIGTAGGAIGGANGLLGARIQRRDIRAQEKALVGKAQKEFIAKAAWVEKAARKKKKAVLHPSQNLGTKPGQWRISGHVGGGVLYEQIPLNYERVQRRKARAAGVEKALAPRPRMPSMRPKAPPSGMPGPAGMARAKTYRSSAIVTRRAPSGALVSTTRRAGIG